MADEEENLEPEESEGSFDTSEKSPQDTKKLSDRIARIEGQVKGVERMIEEGAYCIDIVNQIRSITSALEGLSTQIMERHLKTCVRDAMRSEDSYEEQEKVAEFIDAVNRFLKK